MTRILFLSALAAFAAAGCAPRDAAAADIVSLTRPQPAPRSSLEEVGGAFPGGDWWRVYGDDQLSALITEALRTAPGLDAAAERVRAVAPARTPRPGEKSPSAEPLDRWRRDRAVLAASASESEAARLEGAQARLLLATGVVRAYGELWRLSADRDAAQARAGQRMPITLHDRLALAALDGDLDAARKRLAVLVGADPERRQDLRPPRAGRASFQLPNGRVEQLVSRRPDLQAARWRAAAAEVRFAATRVSVTPRLSLSAFLGRHALGLNHFISFGSDIGQTGLGLWSPSLDDDSDPGATLDAAQRDRDAAASAYERALVGALRDVAHATASEQALDRRLNLATADLARADAACQALRARGGLAPKGVLLDAETTLAARRTQVAALQAKGLVADATLIEALGAGIAPPGR